MSGVNKGTLCRGRTEEKRQRRKERGEAAGILGADRRYHKMFHGEAQV